MNMFWMLLLLCLAVWEGISPAKRRIRNPVLVNLRSNSHEVVQPENRLCYTRSELLKFGHLASENFKLLPNYEAIRKIKGLKLNKRRVRLRKKYGHPHRSLNLDNLKELQHDPELPNLSTGTVNIGHVNVRSIKRKSDLLYEIMLRENLDIILITESWLKQTDEDNIWLESQEFTNIYNFQSLPRPGK